MTPSIVQHLERHLGVASDGWTGEGPIKILRFPDQPEQGVTTYTTLGLSDTMLPMSRGRAVRQELIIAARGTHDATQVAAMLTAFAEYVLGKKQALLRGDVVGPSEPLIPGVTARAVYSAIPVMFEEGLKIFNGTTPPTVIVWLIPLPARDAALVKSHGWEHFEDLLEATTIDFWDLNRPPIAGG